VFSVKSYAKFQGIVDELEDDDLLLELELRLDDEDDELFELDDELLDRELELDEESSIIWNF